MAESLCLDPLGAHFVMETRNDMIILGSGSPRRLQMLRQAGWEVESRPPAIDDGEIDVQAGTPAQTVLALAWFKAAQLGALGEAFVGIAADTVCVSAGTILGKPVDAEDAFRMLERLQQGVHVTMTGLCLLRPGCSRFFIVDEARVEFGRVARADLAAYVESGEWEGKAGGYNLADRQSAGWPVRCQGDPDTVMGLPMRRLQPILDRLSLRVDATGGAS